MSGSSALALPPHGDECDDQGSSTGKQELPRRTAHVNSAFPRLAAESCGVGRDESPANPCREPEGRRRQKLGDHGYRIPRVGPNTSVLFVGLVSTQFVGPWKSS